MNQSPQDTNVPQASLPVLYGATVVLAACSLLYELLIAQAIVTYAANTVVWYSVTIGLYLGSMGFGALRCQRWLGQQPAWRALAGVEIALSAAGALAVIVVNFGYMFFSAMMLRGHFAIGLTVFAGVTILNLLAVGILSGLELPLLLRLGRELSPRPVANRVLSSDYFGSLLGGLAFPLLFLPHFELPVIGFLVALMNIVVALVMTLLFAREKTLWNIRFGCGLLGMGVLMGALACGERIQTYFTTKYYAYPLSARSIAAFFAPVSDWGEVERYRSPYQTIDVFTMPVYSDPMVVPMRDAYSRKFRRDPQLPANRFLYLNGDFQFWSDVEEIYHEYFAHVAVSYYGRVPRKVLVLGGGDGLLVRELVKYPDVQSVTVVDIDGKMTQLARYHPLLSDLNAGSLRDPRVTVINADAYQYMRRNDERYDAIYLDFPAPKDFALSRLYSREFYAFMRRGLAPDGYAVMVAPGMIHQYGDSARDVTELSPRDPWFIYFNTLRAAGFDQIMPYLSRLETDAPAARAVLKMMIPEGARLKVAEIDPQKGRTERTLTDPDEIVDEVIADHVANLEESFIMMSPSAPPPKYSPVAVPTDVLTDVRLPLVFFYRDLFRRDIDPRKVNSIMRPALPEMSGWYETRLPY